MEQGNRRIWKQEEKKNLVKRIYKPTSFRSCFQTCEGIMKRNSDLRRGSCVTVLLSANVDKHGDVVLVRCRW